MPETTTGYPNRPESIGAILDRGVTLYREALPALFGLSFLASLVGNIPTLATAGLPATRAAYTSLQLTLSLLLLPVSLALTIALFVALDRVARGQAPAIGASMGEGCTITGVRSSCRAKVWLLPSTGENSEHGGPAAPIRAVAFIYPFGASRNEPTHFPIGVICAVTRPLPTIWCLAVTLPRSRSMAAAILPMADKWHEPLIRIRG